MTLPHLAYIICCGSCLPEEVHVQFVYGIYGADFCLSVWSSKQLRDVTTILRQPPEVLLQGKLPADISINEIKQFRSEHIQRAIMAIRVEKLNVSMLMFGRLRDRLSSREKITFDCHCSVYRSSAIVQC